MWSRQGRSISSKYGWYRCPNCLVTACQSIWLNSLTEKHRDIHTKYFEIRSTFPNNLHPQGHQLKRVSRASCGTIPSPWNGLQSKQTETLCWESGLQFLRVWLHIQVDAFWWFSVKLFNEIFWHVATGQLWSRYPLRFDEIKRPSRDHTKHWTCSSGIFW